mgnify:CR=1 FL=1
MTKLKRLALTAALAATVVPALQGCFPVVATGVGVTALVAADRRTSGTYLEDEGIEWKAQARVGDRYGDKVHLNVTSFNRNVLLTGEVIDEATKAEVERLVSGVPNVRGISNELVVGWPSSLTARSNDAYISSKVKARFVEYSRFPAQVVKVVTEAGTVFLMGMVTQQEADHATEIARTTSGVQRVVRVFEYVSDSQAKQLDSTKPAEPASTPRR